MRRESDRAFLRNIHEQYYGSRKRREMRREETKKQLWLFEDMKKSAENAIDQER